MSAAVLIAQAVETTCDVDASLPVRPTRLSGRLAYVDAAEEWKRREERFCGVSVGLDIYLMAGVTDMTEAFAWLDAETDKLLALDVIELDDDRVMVGPVGRPTLFVDDGGGSFLGVRIQLSRFSTGD